MTRAEQRRDDKRIAKNAQYERSGFKGGKTSRFNGTLASDQRIAPDFGRSRYMPHVGAKQKAKAAARLVREMCRLSIPQPDDDGLDV